MENNNTNEKRTTETIEIPRAEYEYLVNMNRWLTEQLANLKKQKFGSKSEAASSEVYEQMCLFFNEAETTEDLKEIESQKTVVPSYERSKKEHKFMLDTIPEGTEVEVEDHTLEGDELVCPNCGAEMKEIGTEVVRTLKIVPAKIVVHEDIYHTYACKQCNNDESADYATQIIQTPHVPALYPGSNASASAVAYLMSEKYVMGSPLYRMEADFKAKGYNLSRQTMSNWIIHCSGAYLTPIYRKLKERLRLSDIIHADETELQVLHEPGRKATTKSYMWLYRTGKYAEQPIVLYEYCPGRASSYPREFLGNFSGYLQTDGYCAYGLLTNVTNIGCMAHLKRKFHEAVTALPNGKKTGAAVEGEAYCSRLFELEQQFADLSPEERKIKRIETEKPVLEKFFKWGETRCAAPKSKLGEALTYLNNNKKELSEYLNDGRLEISNNLAERSIKPFVIDRKNFLFSNTPRGATSSATVFSIIQTAKENGLDPFKYLTYIFERGPALTKSDDNDDWVLPLMPENAPDECKVSSFSH